MPPAVTTKRLVLLLLFFGIRAAGSGPDAACAQPPAAAGGANVFLAQAAGMYGLNQPGSRPWRLKISFELLDAKGNATDHGTYEELWANQYHFKRAYASTAFTQTQYGSERGVLFTGNPGMAPQSEFWLRAAFASPMASEKVIANSLAQFRSTAGGNSAGKSWPGCYELRAPQQPANWPSLAVYCFDDGGHLATFTVGFPRMGDATFEHPVEFYGHLLPGDVLMKQNGVPVLKAHLESVSWLSGADEPEMQPPPDAQPWQPMKPVTGRATSSGAPSSAH